MDINELIRQTAKEVLAESTTRPETDPTAAPGAPASGPITVNIQGQPVTFRDQADLEAQLNATAQAIRQQQAAPVTPPEPTGGRVTDDDGAPKFNNDEYIRLMNENPVKAQNYVLSHTLFGGQVEDAAEVLRETMRQAANANKQLAAFQFRASHGEIPIDNPQVSNTIEQARQMLGLPHTNQGLEAAYAYAVQKGALPDFRQVAMAQYQQQQAQQGQPQQTNPYAQPPANPQFGGQSLYPTLPGQQPYAQPAAPQNPYLQAPPSPGRSQQVAGAVTLDDLDNMSTDQLATLLNRLSSAGITG